MRNILRTLLKCLFVGSMYAITLAVGGLIVNLFGLSLPKTENAISSLMWAFVGGTIAGLFLGPIAATLPYSTLRHVLIWSSVILFNLVSVTIEGYFFAPDLIGDSLPGLIFQQILTAFVTGWAIAKLFGLPKMSTTSPLPSRSLLSWTWRFITSTLVYVVFYFVIGGINYSLVTKPYYETHEGGLDIPAVEVTLTAEVIRGAFIALSVIPFLRTVPVDKKLQAVQTGFILFAIGGLVPLTMQVGVLPLFLLVASAWEIFFTNFPTGIVLAYWLGKAE